MLEENTKKDIITAYLNLIYIVADKECQRRMWVHGEGLGSDFDEICCLFFDDIGDPILENYQKFQITENQYQLLLSLRNQFYIFSRDNNWPALFIDTPAWEEIIERAQEVLRAFHYCQEGKRDILYRHLHTVSLLSDKEYQKRAWIPRVALKKDDFDEIWYRFFDKGDLILEHYSDFDISKEQYQVLLKFRNAFQMFSTIHRNNLKKQKKRKELPSFLDSEENDIFIAQHKDKVPIGTSQKILPQNDFSGCLHIKHLPASFIDTPEWNEIVELAKAVLRAFHYNPETSE